MDRNSNHAARVTWSDGWFASSHPGAVGMWASFRLPPRTKVRELRDWSQTFRCWSTNIIFHVKFVLVDWLRRMFELLLYGMVQHTVRADCPEDCPARCPQQLEARIGEGATCSEMLFVRHTTQGRVSDTCHFSALFGIPSPASIHLVVTYSRRDFARLERWNLCISSSSMVHVTSDRCTPGAIRLCTSARPVRTNR